MITVLYYIRSFVLWINYKLGRYKVTLWLIGDARSGTTWISSLLNPKHQLRELFEPFHPNLVDEASFLRMYEYVRPGEISPQLREFCADIFSGNLFHLRIDRASKKLVYNGLLVKDIFANLLAFPVHVAFPRVKTILLIRNPFAVALSKQGKGSWDWQSDPRAFLQDEKLVEDYLTPFTALIEQTASRNDFILNQILIWAIVNYVPLRQFHPEELPILFYEEVLQDPIGEISRVKQQVGLLEQGEQDEIPESVIQAPSAVTEKKKGAFNANLTSWKAKISSEQYREGVAILTAFQMRDFFDENWQPDPEAVRTFMVRSSSEAG